MWVERSHRNVVKVWVEERWDYNEETSDSDEFPPDLTLTPDQMNALVVEWLRGPAGVPGPVGPMGHQGVPG